MKSKPVIAVIGRGLIGSAAAKYLAKAGTAPIVIGPDEPAQKQTHQGVFASHYDAGRITRVLDPDPIWGQLARNSIETYAEIEAQSGIQFYHPSGCLSVGPGPIVTPAAVTTWHASSTCPETSMVSCSQTA